MHKLLTTTIMFLTCILSSCGKNEGAAVNPSTEYQTDLAGLEQRINLPEQPTGVRWMIVKPTSASPQAIGPTDYSLVAELSFSPEATSRIRSMLESEKSISDVALQKDFVRDWFAPTVRSAFIERSGTNYWVLSGVTAVEPTPFKKSPLIHGFVFMTPDGKVFINMFTT